MTLALAPLMLSIPFAEKALHALFCRISDVLSETDFAEIDQSGGVLSVFHRLQSLRYVTLVALVSLTALPLVWLLAHVGALSALGADSTALSCRPFASVRSPTCSSPTHSSA